MDLEFTCSSETGKTLPGSLLHSKSSAASMKLESPTGCNPLYSLLFQACTGIENIDEAITLLEQNNWDLLVRFFFFLLLRELYDAMQILLLCQVQ